MSRARVACVVPLLGIALAFIVLRRRLTMTEGAAKVLKAVSGGLLTVFGLLFPAGARAAARIMICTP